MARSKKTPAPAAPEVTLAGRVPGITADGGLVNAANRKDQPAPASSAGLPRRPDKTPHNPVYGVDGPTMRDPKAQRMGA